MNGETKEIAETFRYELGLAMKPVTKSIENAHNILVEHGEDIINNKKDIEHLQDDAVKLNKRKTTVSGWVIVMVVGLPTSILATIAIINYINGVV